MMLKPWALAALPIFITVTAASPAALQPEIRTSDVERFYKLYDATNGKPSAAQLQEYIDGGTDGFLAFAKMRAISGERIAQAIEKRPEIYIGA
ncbi:MAG TPA: hypothetical protein VFO45_05215, partial [Sphingomicrobium sp.]|nr:hypothetical protein [Sphingomicrobium sp.]